MRPVVMEIRDFDYVLPPELIAQHPAARRDESRLMVVNRTDGTIEDAGFCDIGRFITSDDLVVLNDTRVIPARLYGRKESGARIETFLLRELQEGRWECLLRPGRRCRTGTRIQFVPGEFEAVVGEEWGEGRWILNFEWAGRFEDWLEKVGQVPLPPYIHRGSEGPDREDRVRYQTVFARHSGSVAAPTAGLHFTPALLRHLRHCTLTLHVGMGTFRPVQVERVEDHRMDTEPYTIESEAADAIRVQLAKGGRLVAVGTTTTRVLEHEMKQHGAIQPGRGETALYIYPGFRFRAVGALVTNFHLPKSTLLLLVTAFGGRELILEAYRLAVERKYRFYSYGDAMLVL